jgi:uncharacterized protein (TIGR04141 family)
MGSLLRLFFAILMPKLKTFSLHWAKESVVNFDELLTEKARELLHAGRAAKTLSDQLGDSAVLYSFPGFRDVPTWAKQLQPAFIVPGNIFSESACGILAFKKAGHIFALSLAHGHVYLNDTKTTADFGFITLSRAV